MSLHKDVLENIAQSFKTIRILRTNVGNVFESLITNGTTDENKEQFLISLQELLNTVNSNLK